jgi:hypothetical protein
MQHMAARHQRVWTHRNFLYLQACFLLFLGLAGSAHAANPAGQSYAKVLRLSGTVTAVMSDPDVPRKLQMGDTVFVGERIQAEAGSEAVLQTSDSGYIALRPGSVFVVEQFAANKQDSDQISMRLIQGGLRLLTGWIGKTNPKGFRIATPTATIGIRGTDHEPYVVTDELAATLAQPAGTYDKVNSGATILEANSKSVDIDPGYVGFVRLTKPTKNRALMTLLLPVILDSVPGFYLPGKFDEELDRISSLDSASTARLDAAREAAQHPVTAVAAPLIPATLKNGQCNSSAVAKAWLARLDGALVGKDSAEVLSLFAPEVSIRSVVKTTSGGTTTLNIGRDEFAASTRAAMKALGNYSQSRPTVTGTPARAGHCDVVLVKSVAVEQGLQNGKPYRFRSSEEYQLELRDHHWVATKAMTTQL